MSDFDHLYFNTSRSPTETAETVCRHGCIVLRNALDPYDLGRCHEAAIQLFETDKADYGRENISRDRGWCNGSWFAERHLGHKLAFAKMVAHSELCRHLQAMLVEPALHPLGHVRYRHHNDSSTALPFHQHPHHDDGGELHSERIRMLNVLIPFTDFDGTCADMEYVAQVMTKLLPISETPETQFANFELDKRPILEVYADSLWRPHVSVGDVLVFRDGTLHRTFTDPSMTRQRTSIDLRIFDATEPLSVYHGSPGFALPSLNMLTAA